MKQRLWIARIGLGLLTDTLVWFFELYRATLIEIFKKGFRKVKPFTFWKDEVKKRVVLRSMAYSAGVKVSLLMSSSEIIQKFKEEGFQVAEGSEEVNKLSILDMDNIVMHMWIRLSKYGKDYAILKTESR